MTIEYGCKFLQVAKIKNIQNMFYKYKIMKCQMLMTKILEIPKFIKLKIFLN